MKPDIDKSTLLKKPAKKRHQIKNDKIYNVNDKEFTLRKIRESLSENVYRNPAWRGLTVFLLNIVAFAAVNVFLWQANTWYTIIPLVVADGLLIASLFIIGHDSAHSALFKSSKLNWWVGQISMLPSLHSYNQWAYGHNRIHHGHTVKLRGDFVWEPSTVEQYNNYNFIQKLMHKIYWSRFGAGIYYAIEIWLKGMMIYSAPQKGVFKDKSIVLAFLVSAISASFYFGATQDLLTGFSVSAGLFAVLKMIIIPTILWNYTMGFTIYVHHISPEITWKNSKEWSPTYGQLFGTINYKINPVINLVFHNIFIHMPHHVEMRIPYYNLPLALEEIKSSFGKYVIERKTLFRDYFRSTKLCKVYDPDSGDWLTYREAKILQPQNKTLHLA